LKDIGQHFGLHYSRVSRIVRMAKDKTWPSPFLFLYFSFALIHRMSRLWRSHEKRITQKIRLLLGSEILWISATPLMWKKSWITPAELPHNFYAQSIY